MLFSTDNHSFSLLFNRRLVYAQCEEIFVCMNSKIDSKFLMTIIVIIMLMITCACVILSMR